MLYLVFMVIFAIAFTALGLGFQDVVFPNYNKSEYDMDPPIPLLTVIAAIVWPLSLVMLIGIGLAYLIKKWRNKNVN